MNDKFEELFKAMHQFHKLRIGEMMPNVSGADFWAMNNIVNKSEDGKITISELAKRQMYFHLQYRELSEVLRTKDMSKGQ